MGLRLCRAVIGGGTVILSAGSGGMASTRLQAAQGGLREGTAISLICKTQEPEVDPHSSMKSHPSHSSQPATHTQKIFRVRSQTEQSSVTQSSSHPSLGSFKHRANLIPSIHRRAPSSQPDPSLVGASLVGRGRSSVSRWSTATETTIKRR
jgi:exopolyphosphatase/pppGpp-phosphohydrolase